MVFVTATLRVVALVCLAALAILPRVGPEDGSPRPPAPTETLHADRLTGDDHRALRDDRRAFRSDREAYFESLHRAAPDVDWRAIEESNRADRLQRQLDGRALARRVGPQGQWTERGSNNLAGRVHVVALHENDLYAGSAGGVVWRRRGGGDWQPLNDPLAMNDIHAIEIFERGTVDRIFVYGDDTSMARISDDDGATWTSVPGLSGPEQWGYPLRADVLGDAGQTLFLLAAEWDYQAWKQVVGLYRSVDQGASMLPVSIIDANSNTVDLWSPDDLDDRAYLVVGNQLYGVDSSGTIENLATMPLATTPSWTQVRGRSTGSGVEVFVAYGVGGNTEIHRWATGMTNGEVRGTVANSPFMRNSFHVDRAPGNTLALGGVNTFRSLDGGQTWSLVNQWWEYYSDPIGKLHADVPGIQSFDVGGTEVTFISTDGGLYESTNDLATVTNISQQGLFVSQYYDVFTSASDPNVVFAGSQDQGFQRSVDTSAGIKDFTQVISGDYAHLVSGNGGTTLWCVYPGFTMVLPNAPASDVLYMEDFDFSGAYWLPPLMADPDSPAVVWLGGGSRSTGAHLFRCELVGDQIVVTEGTHDFSGGSSGVRISALATSPTDGDVRYVMTSDGRFHRSVNAGTTWDMTPAFAGPEGHYFHGASIVGSPTDPGTVWIAGSGYSNPAVYVSTDDGMTFAPMANGLPSTLAFMLAVSDDGQLFAATEAGPFAYDASAQTWVDIGDGVAPDQRYWSVEWVESIQTARFGTYGRGIWDFALDTITSAPPKVASLAIDVAPSPFNPTTVVSFTGRAGVPARVRAFDARGRMVAELFEGIATGATQNVQWRADDLASGVYFVRIESDAEVVSQKAVLVK